MFLLDSWSFLGHEFKKSPWDIPRSFVLILAYIKTFLRKEPHVVQALILWWVELPQVEIEKILLQHTDKSRISDGSLSFWGG